VRFASLIYEAFLLVPVLFVAAYLFLALFHQARTQPLHLLFQLWLLAVVGAYFVYCWVKSGQTLAMKTWRLRVERCDGQLLTPARAVVRFLIAAAGLFLAGIGFVWALFDPDGRFLHDRIAGSRIVKITRRGSVTDARDDKEASAPSPGK